MAAVPQFDLTWFRGERRVIRFQMDPNPVGGIAGRTVQFTMRKKMDQNAEFLKKSTDPAIGGITVVDGPAGTADITIDSADTASFKLDAVDSRGQPVLDENGIQVGIWQADVQFVDSGHETVAARGTVTLRQAVRAFPA